MNPSFRPLLLVIFALTTFKCTAQVQNPYIINGTAHQDNCNCYTLTEQMQHQAGSVWNKYKINLDSSFDYKFNVFLGCTDSLGADGIVFVLQPIGTSIGGDGQGLGFENVSPSVGVTIDTWQNIDFKDPPYDHMGIYKNGDLVNGTANTLAGPVSLLADDGNIEDCKWHTFRISWDARGKYLTGYIDGVQRARTHTDLVATIFNKDPHVYWGFSGATGGYANEQKFCTSLNPAFTLPAGQSACAPAALKLKDNSLSFGSIVKWDWDFGDGTTYQGQSPPVHSYPTPGYYTVKLNIVGNNGCLSDTFRQVLTIGSQPVAEFHSEPKAICALDPIWLKDDSKVQYGTLNEWDWTMNDAPDPVVKKTPDYQVKIPLGLQKMAMRVKTVEGCVSAPVVHLLDASEKPKTGIASEDGVCYGYPVHFTALDKLPSVDVRQYYWSYGDGRYDSSSFVQHTYLKGGPYTASLYAVNEKGCASDTLTKNIMVYRTAAKATGNTIVAIGQPFPLQASGGWLYDWSPATGLSDVASDHPTATLTGDITYVLKAYTPVGCATYDTILIKAYRGPELYVPNAFTPNNDGRNDRFRAVTPGISEIAYFRIYNRGGQLIYSSKDTREGWDGNWQGKPQPSGGYVWMIGGRDYLGKGHTAQGTLVLIR